MQTIGPYRLLQALGTCQVGGVWSAIDTPGNHLTLAILNADAARDPGWRNAFAEAASRLGQSGQIPVVTGDFHAPTPWVASASRDGSVVAQVFGALGVAYQPLATPSSAFDPPPTTINPVAGAVPPAAAPASRPDPAEAAVTDQFPVVDQQPPAAARAAVPVPPATSAPPAPSSPASPPAPSSPAPSSAAASPSSPAAPSSGPPSPASPPPAVAPPVTPPGMAPPGIASPGMAPHPAHPAPPVPTQTAYPVSPAMPPAAPPPMSGQPYHGAHQLSPDLPPAMPAVPPPMPPAGPQRFRDDTPPHGFPPVGGAAGKPRRRTALLVGLLVLAVLVLGGGGAAVAISLRSDSGSPDATPTNPPSGNGTQAPTQAPPAQPGIEPPLEGEWPADWPVFEGGEPVVSMTNLPGVGFDFQVPEGWSCTNVANAEGLAHYTCGPDGVGGQIGGDVIVRTCPDPCNSDRRVELRRAEEAWGLQWVRDGGYRCWAETASIDGDSRYGLVFVGFDRTTDEGRIDRQVVFRMTAPVDDADLIRKIANSVRSAM